MKCSVFIATSVDGYIATTEGAVDWLHTAGNPAANMEKNPDMGFAVFMASVDCMIMGRKCMETISSMNLSAEQWPYSDTHVVVLSNTINVVPENLKGRVEMFSGEVTELIKRLECKGFKHAYIDGGATITSFLNLKLIDEITITKAPILLGDGVPLFGKITQPLTLVDARATAFPNDFIQINYKVNYL
ncbi:dihydrofolate reductase family protein [Motilimonas cestriensis]|uniref:Dihydrofolate reductase family protein n=1 Tax=Motilimonas cestriensis TaxID=2742685 RepID=A0ABS8W478_9GAMM|nr:dihydrofolate reductase family protein [Motilimonas cestriensis]MCE2593767.1 dihydrofolate reductase family protein [Motilimonas cestriensis]